MSKYTIAGYYLTMTLKAEAKLFKVPRYGLPGDAAVFDSMFALATDGAGSSDENPIRLDADVTAADFRSLLKAAFPPYAAQFFRENVDYSTKETGLARWPQSSLLMSGWAF